MAILPIKNSKSTRQTDLVKGVCPFKPFMKHVTDNWQTTSRKLADLVGSKVRVNSYDGPPNFRLPNLGEANFCTVKFGGFGKCPGPWPQPCQRVGEGCFGPVFLALTRDFRRTFEQRKHCDLKWCSFWEISLRFDPCEGKSLRFSFGDTFKDPPKKTL